MNAEDLEQLQCNAMRALERLLTEIRRRIDQEHEFERSVEPKRARYLVKLMLDSFDTPDEPGSRQDDHSWRTVPALWKLSLKTGKQAPWGRSRQVFYNNFYAFLHSAIPSGMAIRRDRRSGKGYEYRIDPQNPMVRKLLQD